MESDKNPLPKIELFRPLRTLGHLLLESCSLHLLSPVSEHFQNTGGGPLLDEALMTENIAGATDVTRTD